MDRDIIDEDIEGNKSADDEKDLDDERELTEEEQREEMMFRFKLLREAKIEVCCGDDMTLDELKEIYDQGIAKYKERQEENYRASLIHMLVVMLRVDVDRSRIYGDPATGVKPYTSQELSDLLDAHLADMNLTRDDLVRMTNVIATILAVSVPQNKE